MQLNRHYFKALPVLLAALFSVASSYAATMPTDASVQERVSQLIQNGMYFYWNGGDIKKAEREFFKGITLKGRLDVVEASFRDAAKLMPDRLDLRFDIASALIAQKKLPEALQVYQDVQRLDASSFEAPMLYAAYSLAAGDQGAYQRTVAVLSAKYPDRTRVFLDKFARVEQTLRMPIKATPSPDEMPQDKHAIVLLGYALAKDGSIQPTLLNRLSKALELARLYPKAPLVLTGGMAKAGVTESFVMSRWLMDNGVARERLYLEDQAKDTVGNALYSCAIIQNLGVTHVTLVTSASHVRRGMTVLQEACRDQGLALQYDHLVELDAPSIEEAQKVSDAERLAIYRDLMRVSGMWAFPGIQQ